MSDTGTVLGYVEGAQTILALYSSPGGPTDMAECLKHVTTILEAPELIAAQMRLRADHGVVMILGNPDGVPAVIGAQAAA